MTAQLKPNTTQIPNYLLDEVMPHLSPIEFMVLMVICRQTYGWHKEADRISYSKLVEKTGNSRAAIASALKSLREKSIIQVLDKNGKRIITREEAQLVQELYYRVNATSPKIGHPQSKIKTGTSPNSGHTKETIKTLTNVRDDATKKLPSCPLLKVLKLKDKYPKGHIECVEYVTSFKFVNKGKQFRFLHQMLRAGLDFPDIDRLITRLKKKSYFQENGYDFATIAGEADRRFNAQSP